MRCSTSPSTAATHTSGEQRDDTLGIMTACDSGTSAPSATAQHDCSHARRAPDSGHTAGGSEECPVCLACTHQQQQPTSADTTPRQQQRTTHRHSRRVTSACPRRCRLLRSEDGEATTQTETSHAASSSAVAATAHTHRSRCSAGRSRRGRSRRSGQCLRQKQHVSHATHDHAGEAATNGPQRRLTAAGPGVGAAAGAAACITHHSDARTVTAAHTTGQPTHAVSDATSVALTAAAPPASAAGTAGEAAA
jgi:hypothetical protein